MAILAHAYCNKPANSVHALLRVYALVCAGGAAVLVRALYGATDACGRPLGTYLLIFGALVLGAATLQIVSTARASNRNPLQLMRMPLDASATELATDAVRALLLCPALLVWTLVGAAWTFALGGGTGGALLCADSPALFVASCAALGATVAHAAVWAMAVVWRAPALRSMKQVRQADEDEETALAAWPEGAPGADELPPSPRQSSRTPARGGVRAARTR